MAMLQFDGEKLKTLRKKRNLTQTELGLLVGKKTSNISNYENGFSDPPADTLLNLMSFFQVSARELSRQAEAASV